MNLLRHRPLASVLLTWIATCALSVLLSSAYKIILTAAAAGGALLLLHPRLRGFVLRKLRYLSFLLLAFAAALLFSYFCFDRPEQRLHPYYDEEQSVSARVVAVQYQSATYGSLLVSVSDLSGNDISCRAIAYTHGQTKVSAGDVLTMTATPASLLKIESDSRTYAMADGALFVLNDCGDLSVVGHEDDLTTRFTALRTAMINRAGNFLESDDLGLYAAFFLGERGMLSAEDKLSFRRIGLLHILALSGTHLSLLALSVHLILRLFRVGRKARSVAVIFMILFYTGLTGMPSTVLRAGIMLLLAEIAFLLSSETDPLTTLSISVSAIFLFQPSSIYDLGLYISFAATFGILVGNEYLRNRARSGEPVFAKIPGRLRKLVISFYIGTAANIAVLPFSALFFREFSVYSVPATILISPIFSVYMFLAILSPLCLPISAFSLLLAKTGQLALWLADLLAKTPHCLISLADPALCALLLFGVAMTLLFLLLPRKKGKLLLTWLLIFALCGGHLGGALLVHANRTDLYYRCSSDSEVILLRAENATVCIDAGRATGSFAYEMYDCMTEESITELDHLILTHYEKNTAASVLRLLRLIRINHIWLPEPMLAEEADCFDAIVRMAEQHGATAGAFPPFDSVQIGCLEYRALPRLPGGLGEHAHDQFGFSVTYKEHLVTYISSGYHDCFFLTEALPYIDHAELLILGRHGGAAYSPYPYPCFSSDMETLINGQSDTPFRFPGAMKKRNTGLLEEPPVFRTVLK